MIFVAGVHGVGKTHICNQMQDHIKVYSASQLISEYSNINFCGYKKAYGIIENQSFLINSIKQIENQKETFILDGHFCLFSVSGEIERIPFYVFEQLDIQGIVLFWDSGENIYQRIIKRENKHNIITLNEIIDLQDQEIKYANYIAQELKIPMIKINICDKNKIQKLKQFIDNMLEK